MILVGVISVCIVVSIAIQGISQCAIPATWGSGEGDGEDTREVSNSCVQLKCCAYSIS